MQRRRKAEEQSQLRLLLRRVYRKNKQTVEGNRPTEVQRYATPPWPGVFNSLLVFFTEWTLGCYFLLRGGKRSNVFWSAASSTNTHFVPRCNLKASVARARQPTPSKMPFESSSDVTHGGRSSWNRKMLRSSKKNNNKKSFKRLKKVWCNMSLFCSFCSNRRWELWWTKAFPAQMSLLNLSSCSQQ